MIPPEPDPDPDPDPDPPEPEVPDNVWRVLSSDVTNNWAGSGTTFYKDVMSANGAFVGTVTAGFSTGNFYTTGILKMDNNYYLAGVNGAFKYYILNGSRYYWEYDDEEGEWDWKYNATVGTPFDTVPADLMTYLSSKDFTLTVE